MNTDLIKLYLTTARNKTLLGTDSEPDEHGWTPLHAEVACDDLCKVRKRLEKDKQLLSASNYDGWTPLHVAAALNRGSSVCDETENDSKLAILGHLIKKGADRNARNKDGWTPLHVAVALNGNEEVVRELLSGADARASEMKDAKGRTPLHVAAAKNENPTVIKLLLKCCSVDPCTHTKECESSSHKPATVKRFRVAVNARNKDGCTPLHWAAEKTKNPEIVKVLLDRGADPRLKDGKGRLPIDLAEKNETLRGTEVYWQLHDARYLAHGTWDQPCGVQHCCCGCAPSSRCDRTVSAGNQDKAEEQS